jgi:predicted lipoprotein with Yx(FWY)xxD motif
MTPEALTGSNRMKQWGLLFSLIVCAAVSFADISVIADANDQQWTTDGSPIWINQTSGRVGSQTTDQLTGQMDEANDFVRLQGGNGALTKRYNI